ncbi:MAG: NADH-quinone oxidoreductase subunit C [Desulfovibrio sp.]|jgi:ech hydrogenase subunit D|nr:NADH-quinone oxidoreductase subunit C [Desulfovibrio sp.]
MLFDATHVTPPTLLEHVRDMAEAGCRFVAISQTVLGEDSLRLQYHFDEHRTMTELRRSDRMCHLTHARDRGMRHLALEVPRDASVPSITPIYPCAALAENETRDQFGVRFEGLSPDWDGHFLLEGETVRSPLFTMTIVPPRKAPEKEDRP